MCCTMTPDFGTDQLQSMNAIIQARRTPQPSMTLWQKATAMFQPSDLSVHKSLSTLKLQGFIPQDFVEQGIEWERIPYTMDAIIDFGFRWHHMLSMNIQPHHLKPMEWRQFQRLSIGAKEMMQTCLDVHDLVAIGLTPQQLHQMGWSWDHITAIGGTKDNIAISAQDVNIYFGTKPEPVQPSRVSRFKF